VPAIALSGTSKIAKCAARKIEFRQPIQRDLGRPDCSPKIIRFTFSENNVLLASSRLM
jgi:hypothetical protein